MIRPLELSGVNELDNDDRVRVLAVIDKLRELGINEDVSLPQLVVVGDQSSGKSSLLEGLTGLSFPIASDLCTRFATQIVLRRAPAAEAAVSISIIPGPAANADEEVKKRLSQFGRCLEASAFGSSEFSSILDEAAVCMGLPAPQTGEMANPNKRFSDDVLKIELSGPEHRHLSVVDVPGLFHNPTEYQTLEDKEIIRNLIERYVTDKRTIILAVMDALNNPANQEVFHMARAADPDGTRTVGIITKCDVLQQGDEQGIIKIARNEMVRLNHGWFLVKNRSTKEIRDGVTITQRHANEEQFFSNPPWNRLRKDRIGIAPLKGFLGQLLFDHIRVEFPGMVKEIQNLITNTRNALEELGPPRQTPADQRRFLNRIAMSHQQDASNALSGIYLSKMDAKSPRKLRMHLGNLMDKYAQGMAQKGSLLSFRTVNGDIDWSYMGPAGVSIENQGDIYGWIRKYYRESRGPELPGTVNPRLLEGLFRQQCSPWKDISEKYVSAVINRVIAYNESAMEEFITDKGVRRKIRALIKDRMGPANESAWGELHSLLKGEQEGILQTANHYFADTLSQIRDERAMARLRSMGLQDGKQFMPNFQMMIRSAHISNEDQAVYDIHDILKAYYKVALKRFTDNVIMQVVEKHILGEQGPMKVFTPEFVGELSDTELSHIAEENFATSEARVNSTLRGERLQKAAEIANEAGI